MEITLEKEIEILAAELDQLAEGFVGKLMELTSAKQEHAGDLTPGLRGGGDPKFDAHFQKETKTGVELFKMIASADVVSISAFTKDATGYGSRTGIFGTREDSEVLEVVSKGMYKTAVELGVRAKTSSLSIKDMIDILREGAGGHEEDEECSNTGDCETCGDCVCYSKSPGNETIN